METSNSKSESSGEILDVTGISTGSVLPGRLRGNPSHQPHNPAHGRRRQTPPKKQVPRILLRSMRLSAQMRTNLGHQLTHPRNHHQGASLDHKARRAPHPMSTALPITRVPGRHGDTPEVGGQSAEGVRQLAHMRPRMAARSDAEMRLRTESGAAVGKAREVGAKRPVMAGICM